MALGLANPGAEYSGTRHNVGAEVIEVLASRHGASLRSERGLHARVAEARVGSGRFALGVSQTYVNESGLAARALVHRFVEDDAARLVVVHDELDLPVGIVRVKVGGGSAGHNGLRSVEQHLKSTDFTRVRVGIGRPPGRQPGADYVLSRPSRADRELLAVGVERASDAVEVIAESGAAVAMNLFNTK